MCVLLILATNHVQNFTAYVHENESIYISSVYICKQLKCFWLWSEFH